MVAPVIHLVTFATDDMSYAERACYASALFSGINIPHLFGPRLLPLDMQKRCEGQRGFGWWQWKAWIISKVISGCADGEFIIYSDVGIEFIAPIQPIIDRMDDDIWLFGNNWEHAHWCKRDVVWAVWHQHSPRWDTSGPLTDSLDFDPRDGGANWSMFGRQAQASVIFTRVSDYSRRFVAEWLKWCLYDGGRLIDDSPSRAPNHPEFREHRHDQAILTTLAYREGIPLHWWGARYNMDQQGGGFVYLKLPEYQADDYEPFVHHHRRRDHEWDS